MLNVPPYIASLTPYRPGESIASVRKSTGVDRIIKLASNENPLGPSPKAVAAIQRALGELHRYPDGGGALQAAIAQKFSVSPTEVLASNGSDSLLLAVVRAYVTAGGEVVTSSGSFAQNFLMPQAQGAIVRQAPLREYTFDLPALAQLVTAKTQLILLSNPNNPTGTYFSRAAWETFFAQIPAHIPIVLDEAYAEFVADRSDWPNSLDYRAPNVITLRTFSKAYGLAGLRIGYAIADADVITTLLKVRLPFEPNSLALAAGIAALDDDEHVAAYVQLIRSERDRVTTALQQLPCTVVPSAANFVMFACADAAQATALAGHLRASGIIVRPLHAFGLPHAIRLTIGTVEENTQALAAIQNFF